MDIVKLIGIGLIALVIIIIVKQYKPEFAIYVSLVAGILILGMTFDTISQIVGVINDYTNSTFLTLLLKITGIAILAEFATSICKDAGESAIATKIDIGSKVLIVSASIPIISSLLEVILKVLP